MNQAELVAGIAATTGMPKSQVEAVLVEVAEKAKAALKSGGEISLPGLGKLKTKVSAAHAARNPRTGEAVDVPAKTKVKFVVAKEFRDSMPVPKGKAKKK